MIFVILFITIFINAKSQEKKEIDPSKPTNLYTEVNLNTEYSAGKDNDIYGIRANISYAINSDNLLLLEIPFLHNKNTAKTGLNDIRIRYFTAIKRNISTTLIAIAPFIDVSIPTGKFEDGLGTSCWSISAGSVMGLVFSQNFAVFPGIGIIHITKPNSDLIPESYKRTSTGVGFQFNASYSFNKSTYTFINPNPTVLNTDGKWKTYWTGDVSLNKIFIPNKFKMNISWSPNFTNEVHTLRIGGSFYL
ncbi:MAG: hypothetical protein WC358_09845 [Ignavibacteria bacterium]|jgi:hypothetical protein